MQLFSFKRVQYTLPLIHDLMGLTKQFSSIIGENTESFICKDVYITGYELKFNRVVNNWSSP